MKNGWYNEEEYITGDVDELVEYLIKEGEFGEVIYNWALEFKTMEDVLDDVMYLESSIITFEGLVEDFKEYMKTECCDPAFRWCKSMNIEWRDVEGA